MKTWKQPTLLTRNSPELNGAIFILYNKEKEDANYLYYFFKANDYSQKFLSIKGLLLASAGISNSILYDDIRILSFDLEGVNYKATCKTYLNEYFFYVIVPYSTPDNIVLFINDELIQFCNLFFENFSESKNFTNILNKYCEILFYLTSNYTIDLNKMDIIGTPISFLPLMNLTFTYNEMIPTFMVKPGLSDPVRTDIIENMNTLNCDRSVLQETLTLVDPPFYVKGYVLMYRGFVIFNTLSNKEMANGSRLALLHELYMRTECSPEVLSCEFLFDSYNNIINDYSTVVDENKEYSLNGNNDNNNNSSSMINSNPNKLRKKTLFTLLSQREFTMLISLEILGKNNCSFDPFYHKRAEDLLVSFLKKDFSAAMSKELMTNSIKMNQIKSQEEEKEKNLKEVKPNETNKTMSNKSIPKQQEPNIEREMSLKNLNKRIKGFIDIETQVNIIHFSCYDDSECVINTTDLNVTTKIYRDIYNFIFKTYAKIQSNINKIKNRNKKIKISDIFSYKEKKDENIYKTEINDKLKITQSNFIQGIKKEVGIFKINEYGAFLNNNGGIPIWICCKIYEHITIEDDINMDEYSNYKIIFVSYESQNPVETDSFCQDLLMNDWFI